MAFCQRKATLVSWWYDEPPRVHTRNPTAGRHHPQPGAGRIQNPVIVEITDARLNRFVDGYALVHDGPSAGTDPDACLAGPPQPATRCTAGGEASLLCQFVAAKRKFPG